MPTGRVKWYDKTKGFGFIESPEGDVFFHFSDIQMEGFKALAEDQRVSYESDKTDKGLKAKDVRPLDRRATVRHAARYRTLVHVSIRPGAEADFDRLCGDPPEWMDSVEQDLAARKVGLWRVETTGVFLMESDLPFEQVLDKLQNHRQWDQVDKLREKLRELLTDEPKVMDPVALPEEVEPEATPSDEPQEDEPQFDAEGNEL